MLKNGGKGDETAEVLHHDELQRQDSSSSGEELMGQTKVVEEVNIASNIYCNRDHRVMSEYLQDDG